MKASSIIILNKLCWNITYLDFSRCCWYIYIQLHFMFVNIKPHRFDLGSYQKCCNTISQRNIVLKLQYEITNHISSIQGLNVVYTYIHIIFWYSLNIYIYIYIYIHSLKEYFRYILSAAGIQPLNGFWGVCKTLLPQYTTIII